MKNVDVPMWDKGDNTDSYAKGGSSMFSSSSIQDKIPVIEEAFQTVLGRKPTSRELSYYKYSAVKKEDLVNKLLDGQEHKDLIEKARNYPELEDSEKKAKATIISLKHGIEDSAKEYDEMKSLLKEKNNELEKLRKSTNVPYIHDINKLFQTNNRNQYYPEVKVERKEDFFDKLFKFIKKFY